MTAAPFLNFLTRLAANNHRDWFDANRSEYQALRNDLLKMTEELILQIKQFDPSIGTLSASDCLFRINRDIRFSKNKDPYKTNMGVYVTRGGRKSSFAGYYLHIEPGASFIGGGVYMPMPPLLKKLRQEIFYNYPKFKSIITAPEFVKIFGSLSDMGDRLTRPPKGYDSSFEGIDYLMNKHFVVGHSPDEKVFANANLVNLSAEVFKVMREFNAFLNVVVEE